MNEKIPEQNNNLEGAGESPEEQEQRGEEMLEAYLAEHPELSPEVEKVEYSEEMKEEIEGLLSSFESNFSLEELSSITTKEEAINSQLREDAKKAIEPIHKYFEKIKRETNISTEEEYEIEKRRKKISMAIGFVNSGVVRHE